MQVLIAPNAFKNSLSAADTAAAIKEVVVSGTDVNVIVANVAKINVTGNDVNVVWANGIGGKQPKISQKKGNDINIGHNGK